MFSEIEMSPLVLSGFSLNIKLKMQFYKRPGWSKIAKFLGPTWGPPGSYRPQMGPMNLAIRAFTGFYGEMLNNRALLYRRDIGKVHSSKRNVNIHENVMTWECFLRYWSFVRGIHWSLFESSENKTVILISRVSFDNNLKKIVAKSQETAQWRKCLDAYLTSLKCRDNR